MRLTPPRGFIDAVVNPVTNALICAASIARVKTTETIRKQRASLIQNALKKGPIAMGEAQRMAIISDPVALSKLHAAVWASAEAHAAWWSLPAQAPRSSEAASPVAQPA